MWATRGPVLQMCKWRMESRAPSSCRAGYLAGHRALAEVPAGSSELSHSRPGCRHRQRGSGAASVSLELCSFSLPGAVMNFWHPLAWLASERKHEASSVFLWTPLQKGESPHFDSSGMSRLRPLPSRPHYMQSLH